MNLIQHCKLVKILIKYIFNYHLHKKKTIRNFIASRVEVFFPIQFICYHEALFQSFYFDLQH